MKNILYQTWLCGVSGTLYDEEFVDNSKLLR